MKIPIAEIFGPTIQGEGPNVGCKCIFVRVVGCDFNCAWCDSKFAWQKDKNTKLYDTNELVNLLIDKCMTTHTGKVILTGGNPCLYDFEDLVLYLSGAGITVDVETQGSKLPNWLKYINQLVISPKAPSSKQIDVFDTVHDFLQAGFFIPIAIKIPIFNEDDFMFSQKYYNLVEKYSNVKMYLSVGNTDTNEVGDISNRVLKDYEKLINKVCNSNMKNVYVLPQMHTLVWGNKPGV